MLFNSYEFIFLFLPIAVIGFFLVSKFRRQYGTLWLVLASLFFYGWWNYRYVPLLMASICFNYWVGHRLETLAAEREAANIAPHTSMKTWLAFGIIVNVALLGYFKYTDFFLETVNALAGADWFDLPHIVLPLGISFFTFTQTAYLVDAYRGEAKTPSFLTYCEFVTIFPHLIAGPIINHKDMMPQFVSEKTFKVNWDNIAMGLSLFTMGLCKKVVIADKLSHYANDIFARTDALTCLEAWLGALSYTLQLYFDFSGYSEMAMGLGLIINLRLPQNFDSPYKSLSIIDFWRRWHMTLGQWVKNYLYIPMGGGRGGQLSKMRNLFVSMLIIGLWHGAGWTFVFWGAWHGVLLMINHLWRTLHVALPKFICWALTIAGATIGWVFFRATTFTDAWNILTTMVNWHNIVFKGSGSFSIKSFVVVCLLFIIMPFLPNPVRIMNWFKPTCKWLFLIIVLGILSLYKFSQVSDFLYFQF